MSWFNLIKPRRKSQLDLLIEGNKSVGEILDCNDILTELRAENETLEK
jgi:hypothetical protein